MQRDFAKVVRLRSKVTDDLIAKGDFVIGHALPTTPDFTLMASNRFSAAEQGKLGAAAAAALLKPVSPCKSPFIARLRDS